MSSIFIFECWKFDSKSGVLYSEDKVIQIEPQQSNLLLLLLNNQGKTVTRDEIISEIWQNIIVEDNTVSKAITRLRQLLNDNARNPLFIKTVPKRGYQFIAQVTFVDESAKESTATPSTTYSRLSILAVVSVLVVLIWFLMGTQDEPVKPTSQFIAKSTPVTYREGRDQNASFHPTQQRIVFNGKVDNRYFIFEKKIADASAKALIEVNSPLASPVWLTDRQFLAVSQVDKQGHCQLYKVSTISPQLEPMTQCLSDKPIELTLLPNEQALYWQDKAGLWLYYWQENRKEQLSIAIGKPFYTRLSPDGNLLAALYDNDSHTQVIVYDDSSKVITRRILGHSIQSILWGHTGDSLIFLGQHPAKEIFKMNLQGNVEVITNTSYGTISHLDDINQNGQLLFTVSAMDIDVAQLNKSGTTTIVNSAFADYNAAISPDLKSVAFASKRSGKAQILIKQNDNIRQLSNYNEASYIYDIAWSPNSEKLLVKRNNQIYVYLPKLKTKKQLPLNAETGKNWQWATNHKLAYINKDTNTLFFYDLKTNGTELIKSNVANAQRVNNIWYIAEPKQSSLFKFDNSFKNMEVVNHNLAGREWFVYQNEVHVFNKNPSRISKLTPEGEQDILLGNQLNPLSVKPVENFGLVFNQINNNEANIYMVELNKK